MSRQIVLAKFSDAYEIAVMSRDFIEYGLGWSWTPGRIVKHIRDQDTLVIKVVDGQVLLGFAVMHFGFELTVPQAHINLIAVKPEFRKQGIARGMLLWMQKSALNAGIEEIVLEVRAGNRGAINFYKKMGYREYKITANYYGGKESALRMRKTIINRDHIQPQNVVYPWEKWQDS